jgi:hypothetical protein
MTCWYRYCFLPERDSTFWKSKILEANWSRDLAIDSFWERPISAAFLISWLAALRFARVYRKS